MSVDVIVIGAGFAGLSAATALAARGVRVLTLEARPTLGGRATAFTDPETGERVDNGQHVLFGCYHETFAFLRRINALTNVRVQPRLEIDVVDSSGDRSRLACAALPAPLHLLAGIVRWAALGWRDRVAACRMYPAITRTASPSGTVREWLTRNGQTPRLISLLWEPLALSALNESIDVAAAEPFRVVLSHMLAPPASGASLAIPLKPLDELYALPARAFIEQRGGAVRTHATARIACDESGGASAPLVRVRGEALQARAVICAVPWHALPEVFEPPPAGLTSVLEAAAQTTPSPIVTVNLWFDRIVSDYAVLGLPGRTMQWMFDKRMVFGEHASHLSLVSSGATDVAGWSNEALIERAHSEVADAIPAARQARMVRAVVVREKRATFSVAPGQPSRPATRTPVRGLFLAGDWIETGLPATIEGAVVSGHAAAAAALDLLAHP